MTHDAARQDANCLCQMFSPEKRRCRQQQAEKQSESGRRIFCKECALRGPIDPESTAGRDRYSKLDSMQTYLVRSFKKVGCGFASAASGAAAFALFRDPHTWSRYFWEPTFALMLFCISLASFSALLRLKAPALFFGFEARVKRLYQRLRSARSKSPN